jgi:hypothetical protein
MVISSSQAAAAYLQFLPLVPAIAGPRVVVNQPSAIPPDVRAIAYVYNDPHYGVFDVVEQPAETTESDLEGLVRYNPPPGTPGTRFTVMTFTDGRTGVLEEGAVTVSLRWIQGGVDISIVGPTGSFTTAEALAIGNETGT